VWLGLWFGMTTQSRNLSLYRSCKPVSRRGFTLVELVIVLVVLAVVAALVVPTFQALVSESRGKSEELTLMAVHRQATAHMLADGRTTYIDEDVEQAVGDLPAAFAGVTSGVVAGVSAEGSPRFKIRNSRVVSPGPRDATLSADSLVAATVVGTSVETALQPGELAYDILDSGSTLVLMMASADGETPVFAGGPANGAVSWRVKGAGSGCVLADGARPVNALGEGAVCAPPEGLEGSGGGSVPQPDLEPEPQLTSAPMLISSYAGYDLLFCRYIDDCSEVAGISAEFSYQVDIDADVGSRYRIEAGYISAEAPSWDYITVAGSVTYTTPTAGASIAGGNIVEVTNAGSTRVTMVGESLRDRQVRVRVTEVDGSYNAVSEPSFSSMLAVYTTVGLHTFWSPQPVKVEYLVVAAGGGAGSNRGGGGGGGGYITNSGSTLLSLSSVSSSVAVGEGGAGGNATAGVNGADSSFSTILAAGGGGGGSSLSPFTQAAAGGKNGGSGGGASWSSNAGLLGGTAVAGAGNTGGRATQDNGSTGSGGGGGGAGAVGGDGNTASGGVGGNGGSGASSTLTGTSVVRAGGGGGTGRTIQGVGGSGGGANAGTPGGAGVSNFGGGGGGGTGTGGAGGSGVVIVRAALVEDSMVGGPTSGLPTSYAGYDLLFCRYIDDCSEVAGISAEFSYQISVNADAGSRYRVEAGYITAGSTSWTDLTVASGVTYTTPTAGASVTGGNILETSLAGTARVTIVGTSLRDQQVRVRVTEVDGSGVAVSEPSYSSLLAVYTTVGSHTFWSPQPVDVEYLVIAGGGGGGFNRGGGGGAGGYLTNTGSAGLSLTSQSSSVTVGEGGAGGNATAGVNGVDSSFNAISAVGGGGGGASLSPFTQEAAGGKNGGSGGGASWSSNAGLLGGTAVAGAGNTGGRATQDTGSAGSGGGGGGAGAVGGDGSNASGGIGGNGGSGASSTLTGTSVIRAGGGGGTARTTQGVGGSGGGANAGTPGGAGVSNFGGGGGGGTGTGGAGGSGVVIVRVA
jgi:prepilin-type N-terminal cleavage/methylation domain-containing protein